ncbi:MAG TPA: 5'-nucleotidase C-terminal domain-containing protein [Magnetospirillum sp.]|nr:5'-nucleotidase C-terminal domain-containing protein [Magnetospirillum sp.]
MIRPLTLAGAAALLFALAAPAAAEEARVTFLHFNDVYEFSPGPESGGLGAVKTVVERERASHPGALLTFGGDLLSPSVASNLTKGAHMVDLLNRLQPVAAVLGNHEFDFGAQALRTRMGESRFSWLVTNVSERDGTPFGKGPRLLMVESNGIKVGLFALLTAETTNLSSGGREAAFQSELDTARAAVATLRRDGAEVVVALTHLDLGQDLALAREVKGIDLVLGGHDHNAATIEEGGVPVVKAGHDGVYVAAVDLAVDRAASGGGPAKVRLAGWRLIGTKGEPQAADMVEPVRQYADEVNAALGKPLATLASPLDSREEMVRGGEAAMGNFVADSLRAALAADVALINGGGLRGNRAYDAGSVLTRADLLREMPFGNTVMMLDLSGADLLAALEHGVSKAPALSGRFPQVSGLAFAYAPKAAAGRRVSAVTVAGKPLNPAGRYRVATTDYLADGGDGYAMLKHGRVLIDRNAAPLFATVVMEQAERQGTIAAKMDGRIRVAK